MGKWIASYRGFLGVVEREFKSYERADQWVRQVGKINEAKITKATEQTTARAVEIMEE